MVPMQVRRGAVEHWLLSVHDVKQAVAVVSQR